MIVEPAKPDDFGEISNLLAAAFDGNSEVILVKDLRQDADMAFELVCRQAGEIIGHIVFSPIGAPVRSLALAPIGVLPKRQRAGVGSALINEGLRLAMKDGWQAVFVLGDPAYYSRFGFSAALASPFDSPYGGPYFMALELQKNCLADQHGALEHAPAFARLEGDG